MKTMRIIAGKDIRSRLHRDLCIKGKSTNFKEQFSKSTTLFVANLSSNTKKNQIRELFESVGPIKCLTMGQDKLTKSPCEFCFVEYYTRDHAENAMRCISGTKLDDRVIITQWAIQYKNGKELCRGRSTTQIHERYRKFYRSLKIRSVITIYQ
ncbi:hypothetical protein GJ496_008866 [Pomphorhynchus laevis]|nr:hypothetical protein GJ496_005394 [Pomphorhynchus laevis]KAI0985027.1 hypothetical protein GJ496_008865 [Pomphorhynchus laevis]KAI0985028.1 hypothetical protein GJ496_008866 [Pomphorhynchus laevis]